MPRFFLGAKTVTSLLVSFLFIPGCSELKVINACESAVSNGLLQELFIDVAKSRDYHYADRFGFCRGGPSNEHFYYCDTHFAAEDIKELKKNSFSSSCQASVKFDVKINTEKVKKERDDAINIIKKKAQTEVNGAQAFVLKTFENYGVSPSESDVAIGVEKRLKVISEKEEKQIQSVMSDYDSKIGGYFVVGNIRYISTLSKEKDYVNVNLDEVSYIAEGDL